MYPESEPASSRLSQSGHDWSPASSTSRYPAAAYSTPNKPTEGGMGTSFATALPCFVITKTSPAP